jgi:uncharacterized membrane protein
MPYKVTPMELALIINVILFLFSIAGYLLPTILAALRRHPQLLVIFLVNFLLGWTVIGWIGALAWSLFGPGTNLTRTGSALEVAQTRYAKGEITSSELEDIKTTLQ